MVRCSFCDKEALMIFGDAAVCEDHDPRTPLHEMVSHECPCPCHRGGKCERYPTCCGVPVGASK